MTILDRINERKKERVEHAKSAVPVSELKARIRDMAATRNFSDAIKRGQDGTPRLIAEIKKASPSKGLIRPGFDHRRIAEIYERKSVDAVSVITEEDFFDGGLEFIKDVKDIVSKPVLRKDFILDPYQIFEARANHADAFLLIAAMLGKNQAEEYLHLGFELGMSVLFEVHDEQELLTALDIKAPIVGINNRNLKTMKIDLNTSFELKKHIPEDRITVCESGIRSREDVLRVKASGIDAMLIGTSFMESSDIGAKIDELTAGPKR